MFSRALRSFARPSVTILSRCTRRSFMTALPDFKIGRLNHVAIAVKDLKASANFYKNVMGAKVSEPLDQPEHGVTVVFVELPNTKIELIVPLGEKSPIKGFMEKNPLGGIHHISIEVADINQAAEHMKSKGIRVLGEPKIGAHGVPVIFLHPKDCNGVLVELEEHKENF